VIALTTGRDGELIAEQHLTSPSIYLDHWALRRASDAPEVGRRLTRAIERREGTLTISFANIAEFMAVDHATARRAEEFIDANRPRLFFQDFNPFEVVQREQALMAGAPPAPPHADLDLLRLVVGLRPPSLEPITCLGMLTAVAGERITSTGRMKQVFVDRMASLRADYLNDQDFRAAVDRAIRAPGQPRGTGIILRELLGGLVRDSKAPITQNDAMDFFHAVVPASYCDFALLDGRWRDQVDRLRTRLARLGPLFPVATVYSDASAFDSLLAQIE
jgi:hypothetical protein